MLVENYWTATAEGLSEPLIRLYLGYLPVCLVAAALIVHLLLRRGARSPLSFLVVTLYSYGGLWLAVVLYLVTPLGELEQSNPMLLAVSCLGGWWAATAGGILRSYRCGVGQALASAVALQVAVYILAGLIAR